MEKMVGAEWEEGGRRVGKRVRAGWEEGESRVGAGWEEGGGSKWEVEGKKTTRARNNFLFLGR
jgi:hypothetical protein